MNRMQTSSYNHGYDTATTYFNKVILPQRKRTAFINGFFAGIAASLVVTVITALIVVGG